MKNAGFIVKIILVAVLLGALIGGVLFVELNKEETDGETVITVMSYNVRCFTLGDVGNKSWGVRKKYVAKVIENADPDVIGFQEVMDVHEEFFKEKLKGYSFNVAYREEHLFREGVAIAYKTDKFTLEEEGMFWLSETPEKMSKDWGSNSFRVADYVVLTEKKSGKKFTFFSTHLDNKGDSARKKQLEVVMNKADEVAQGQVIILGDMNDFEDSEMYQAAVNKYDDALLTAENVSVGTGATYQGYGEGLDHERIDYCFVTKGMKITDFKVDTSTFDGIYPSDHFPLIVKVVL